MFNKQFYINIPLIFFLIFFFIKLIDNENNKKIEITFKLISVVPTKNEGTMYLDGASYQKITHMLIREFGDHKLNFETKKNILEYENKYEIEKINFLDNHFESFIIVIELKKDTEVKNEYIVEIIQLVRDSYRENLVNQIDIMIKNSVYLFDRFNYNHSAINENNIRSIKSGGFNYKNYTFIREKYLAEDMKILKIKYNFLNNS